MSVPFLLSAACLSVLLTLCAAQERVLIGEINTVEHDVSGTVYAVNDRTLEIENFNYDGQGPAAVYWIDRGNSATTEGVIAPELDSCDVIGQLPAFDDATVRIELPDGLTLSEVGYFSIWCEVAATSFGGLEIDASTFTSSPPEAEPQCGPGGGQPTERILIGEINTVEHDVSGTVYAVNDRTLEIENFNYDGQGPAVVYWIDRGNSATTEGVIAPELDSCDVIGQLPAFDDATVRIELPDGLTLSEVGYFSIWCEVAATSFGGLEIDASTFTSSPPEAEPQCAQSQSFPVREGYSCESLSSSYQVRWQLDSDNQAVNIELVAVLPEDRYMGFGVSGSDQETDMVGSDVAIAYRQGEQYFAIDYHMSSRESCSAGQGVCPDVERAPNNGVNHISNIEGESEGNVVRISYTRPIAAEDVDLDRPINTDGPTFISWAIGPLDSQTTQPRFHGPIADLDFPGEDVEIDFNRDAQNSCSALEGVSSDTTTERPLPFERPVFGNVTEFTARIGPNGGAKGVEALRDDAWGIAWYISPAGSVGEDVLIPAIGVERGKTYRFSVYGGDPSIPSYHPLYITSSRRGGYKAETPENRLNETIYAGINITGRNDSGVFDFESTAVGALCEFKTDLLDTSNITYQQYYDSLDTSCTQDENITRNAGELVWTVAPDTPDLVYYQCVTHPLLGFEIRVFDEGNVDFETLRDANFGGRLPTDDNTDTVCTVTVDNEEVSFQGCSEIDEESEFTVFWNIDDDEIETLIRVRTDGYAGFGWGYDSMIPGNAAIVYRTDDSSAAISDYQLNQQNTQGVQPDTNQDLTNTAAFVDGDFVIGRFTRRLNVAGLPVISADGETNAIWSVGARPNSPTTLQQHGSRGSATINLARGSATTSGSGPSTFFIVHGVFMGLSWLLFVPTAIITMRYFKKYDPIAFQVHRTLNGTAVILVVVAYFMGIARGNRAERAHLIIGSIVFSLAVLQGLGGLFRPHKGTPARKPWYFGHALMGNVAWSLSVANVFIGIRIITDQGGSGERAWYAVAGIVVGVVLLLHIMLSLFPHRFPTRIDEDAEDVEEKLKAVPDDPTPLCAGVESI